MYVSFVRMPKYMCIVDNGQEEDLLRGVNVSFTPKGSIEYSTCKVCLTKVRNEKKLKINQICWLSQVACIPKVSQSHQN